METAVEEKPEVKEPEAPKPEKTPEELAEIERVRKERDAELKIKQEKANEERLERMAIEEIIEEHGLYLLRDQGLTLEEVLAQVPTEEEEAATIAEYKAEQEAIIQQRRDIIAAKELNKPHELKPDIETEILEVTNRYRREAGVREVTWSDRMHRYSRSYNLYMFTYSIWEHNIVYPSAENLYMSGSDDPYAMDAEYNVNSWMNSPGHKKNLLNPKHKVMGAAVLVGVTKHPVTGDTKPVLFPTQQFFDALDSDMN